MPKLSNLVVGIIVSNPPFFQSVKTFFWWLILHLENLKRNDLKLCCWPTCGLIWLISIFSSFWRKLVWKLLNLLVVKSSVFSQVQKQKVKVALQVPLYSKEGGITRVPEAATRTDTGPALIHIHPLPHFHPPLMSKDRQESRRWVRHFLPPKWSCPACSLLESNDW